MTRGRKPDPAGVKEVKGNTRRQKKAVPEGDAAIVEPKASGGKMPGWLDTHQRIRTRAAQRMSKLTGQVWAFLQPELARLNLVKATDDPALARFCRYMAEWIEYTHVIDREGAYYTTESPHVKDLRRPHPAWRARKDVEQSLKNLGDDLGLSPAARQRLMLQLAGGGMGLPDQGAPTPAGELALPGELGSLRSPIGMLGGGGRLPN